MIFDMRLRAPYASLHDSYSEPGKCEYLTSLARTRFGMPAPESLKTASLDMCLEEMKEAGIEKALVPLRSLGHTMDNADAANIMKDYPGLFYGVPCVDVCEGEEETLKIIDEYVINGPCPGVMTEPGFSSTPLYADDERLYFLYNKCEKENIPLFMSFGGFIGPDHTYCDATQIAHVAAEFPKLKMMLQHGGYPYVNEICHVASNHEFVYLCPDLYVMHSPGWRDYVDAINCMLMDKMVFGSAYPIIDLKAAVDLYQHVGISEESMPKFMYQNALNFMGIEE